MLIFRYLSHVTVRRVSVLLQPKNVGFIITRGCYSCRSDNDKASVKERFKLPKRYGIAETSVWIEYAAVVAELKPKVNLGQGFADFLPPKSALDALTKAVATPNYLLHQYTRGFGYPRLVQNLSKLYSPVFGKEINPMTEILVGAGAYESLYCAILGHVDDGEEVIIIEPYYDCYSEMVKGANGVCRFIPLRLDACEGETVSSADWVLDEEELTSLFNDNTKMIVVNTPHNPIGKVYKKRELELIADLCQKYNVLCLADEVYEFVVYEPNKHVKMATLPGMWERTITVGSAGKVFSATGWRTGWACGPAYLLENMQIVHQNCVFTCNTFVQEALAQALEVELSRRDTPECYMNSIPEELLPKRELMKNALVDNGFTPTEPEGGFFMIADWSKLADKMDLSTLPDKYEDYKFTKMLAKEAGVLALPASAFYGKEHKKLGEKFARFCFIKRDENLKLAADLMKQWNECS